MYLDLDMLTLKIACRCASPLGDHTINKIAQYCDVESDQVISVIDVPSLYHVRAFATGINCVMLTGSGAFVAAISKYFRSSQRPVAA